MTPDKTNTGQRIAAENVIASYLNAAEALIKLGDVTQAELRLRDALKQADASFADNSRVVRHVLAALSDFYRSQQREDALSVIEKRLELIAGMKPEAELNPNTSFGRLFALGKRGEKPPAVPTINPARVPPDIRRACKILGLSLEELNAEAVKRAWKASITDPTAHPDLGGEHEMAILLNTARDSVLIWLENQSPKLGKKFERIVRNNN
jgi:hypothetical protein